MLLRAIAIRASCHKGLQKACQYTSREGTVICKFRLGIHGKPSNLIIEILSQVQCGGDGGEAELSSNSCKAFGASERSYCGGITKLTWLRSLSTNLDTIRIIRFVLTCERVRATSGNYS